MENCLGRSEHELHVQCCLVRGNARQTCWIPAQFADVGSVLRIKTASGKWEGGWIVEQCWSTTAKLEHAPTLVRQHRRQTGDSLPKKPK